MNEYMNVKQAVLEAVKGITLFLAIGSVVGLAVKWAFDPTRMSDLRAAEANVLRAELELARAMEEGDGRAVYVWERRREFFIGRVSALREAGK